MKDQYDSYFNEISNHAGRRFVLINENHVAYLDWDWPAAVVYAKLLNLVSMKSQNRKDRVRLIKNLAFFRCPAQWLGKKLHMKEDQLRRVINTLREASLVETERRTGNVLWIKIREDGLGRAASGQKPENPEPGKSRNRPRKIPGPIDPGKSRNLYITNKPGSNNLKKNVARRPAAARPAGGATVSSFFPTNGKPKYQAVDLERARRLYKRVVEKRRLEDQRSSPEEWAVWFARWRRKYEKADGAELTERVFVWYLKRLGAKYTRQAFCGRSFFEKYPKIRNDMLGDEENAVQQRRRARRACPVDSWNPPHETDGIDQLSLGIDNNVYNGEGSVDED